MTNTQTTLFRWLYGFHQAMLRLVVPYERLLASRWGRGFYCVLLVLAVLYTGFFLIFSIYEALNLLTHSGVWSKYPQGYAGLWNYQSSGHYIVFDVYIAVTSVFILGILLCYRTTWAIAMGLVLPPLLSRYTPDIVYEAFATVILPLLPWLAYRL